MMLFRWIAFATLAFIHCIPAAAAEWTYSWSPAAGEAVPKVEVCPLKYGKDFAYSVEIDDGPALTLAVAQPLLAKHHFTDAPPGLAGGHELPFSGGAAIMVNRLGGNSSYLSTDDLTKLQSLHWGVINHSYWHAGRTWGNPPEILDAAQIRSDLFWSQSILASANPEGRAPSHFVYPNGYTDYRKYLVEFGLKSASRVGGTTKGNAESSSDQMLDINRNYLDEGPWAHSDNGDPMHGFPEVPAAGQIIVDFTHNIEAGPESANHQRWVKRLETIESRFGCPGKDNIWCASSGEVIQYVAARRSMKVSSKAGKITVSLPDEMPGAAVTLKLSGIDEAVKLDAPESGSLYRSGRTVWLTTPTIGKSGSAAPTPAVRCAYEGEVKTVRFPTSVQVAAVRLLQSGEVDSKYNLEITGVSGEGVKQSIVRPDHSNLTKAWGVWRLYDVVPNSPAISATSVEIQPDAALKKMEVWVVP